MMLSEASQQLHSHGHNGDHHRWQPPRCTRTRVAAAAARRQQQRARTASEPQQGELVVGIDLGTTNSAVARVVNGRPVCIPNALGDTLTPSVVCFRPPAGGSSSDTLVGLAARQAATTHPDSTFYSVKRLIGRSWANPAVQEEAARLAYKASRVLCVGDLAPHLPLQPVSVTHTSSPRTTTTHSYAPGRPGL
jgi:hypothetical protein